jgi:hypothetical protein
MHSIIVKVKYKLRNKVYFTEQLTNNYQVNNYKISVSVLTVTEVTVKYNAGRYDSWISCK